MWQYNTPLPGSSETINSLVNLKKRVYLVTNNSQTTREEMLAKCLKMGYNLSVDSMITSSYVTAHYLKQIGFDKKAYVIGPSQLAKELDDVGIQHLGVGKDNLDCPIVEYVMKHFELDEDVGGVIVSFDANFSYVKLCKAVNYLKNEKVQFFATNCDSYFDFPALNFCLPEVGEFFGKIYLNFR